MTRKLSIGVRWALRYTLAMSVTLTVFAIVVHTQVERRINREARLVTEIHARDLLDSLRTQSAEHPPDEVLEWISGRIARAIRETDPDLGLGIEYLDPRGQRIVASGSLAEARVPVPIDLLEQRRESAFRAVNLGGEHAHLLTVLAAPGGFLQVAIDTRRYAENIARVRDVLVLSFPIMLILTGLLGWFLARGSLGAIAEITTAARRISSSNLRERIPTTGSGDELDQLADTLNAMMERIRSGVERMRRFNANAAHEIRTPVNAICSQLEVTLEKARGSEEYRQVLTEVLEQAHHLAAGVEAMLRLSHSEAGLDPDHVAAVPVAPLLATLAEFFEPVAADRGIALQVDRIPDVKVRGDASWLRQMFSNLIDNAIKYSRHGDRIHVRAALGDGWLQIEVADTGSGISADELAGIFDRFQRGNRHRTQPGFGLGLPIAQEIARAHGGRIEARSRPGQGSSFVVWLPSPDGPGSAPEVSLRVG